MVHGCNWTSSPVVVAIPCMFSCGLNVFCLFCQMGATIAGAIAISCGEMAFRDLRMVIEGHGLVAGYAVEDVYQIAIYGCKLPTP